MILVEYLLSKAVWIAKPFQLTENAENIHELTKGTKMKKFLPAVAILAAGIVAIASANARGGWDGNGLSVSGFDLCSLDEKQVNDCSTGVEVPNS